MRRAVFIRKILTSIALLFPLLVCGRVHAQEFIPETYFEAGSVEDVACPPRFPSIYDSRTGMRFFGTSRFTMQQYDQMHGTYLYTYQFEGLTPDGTHKVRGTHHVAAAQCLQAAYSYWTGSRAFIAYLHNETLYIISYNGSCEGLEVENAEYSQTGSPAPFRCEGGGSNTQPLDEDEWFEWYNGARFRCHREYENGWSSVVCVADAA
ncbi:MAG TPA: hypothetical protein VF665_01020 [Longimicrobium sp.]|jgi:hypothetical protein|uniref:hypothetical protein n=1 Tax=Longimicrobium sp. TaxID=2029185 RepID=UPI002EDB0ECF